jgi:hypothetical protein
VSRFWVRMDNGATYCAEGSPPTCFEQQLENPSNQESYHALSQLQEATDRINKILGETELNAPNASLKIVFLAVRRPDGHDRLQLSYIDTNVKVTTFFG